MKELDLTKGSVPKILLQFALPFLIVNVLQALYGGADLFVVGQYDDSASVAGVAIGSQVMSSGYHRYIRLFLRHHRHHPHADNGVAPQTISS